MHKRAIIRSVTILMLILGALIGQNARAQQTTTAPDWQSKNIQLIAKKQSLSDLLEELRKQTGQSFLVDGLPTALTTMDIEFKGSAKEALDKIGDTFDYWWKASKSGIVILYKRFKDVKTAPQINLPEMRQMIKDVAGLLSQLPPHEENRGNLLPSSQYYQALLDILSNQQVADLAAGKPVLAKDLNEEQLQQLKTTIAHVTVFPASTAWLNFAGQLDALSQSYLQIRDWPTSVTGGSKQEKVNVSQYFEFDLVFPSIEQKEIPIPLMQMEKHEK